MQGYREAPAAPKNSTLDYFPHGPRGRYAYVAGLFTIASIVIVFVGLPYLKEIRVHCTHDEGACSIVTTGSWFGDGTQWVPLSIVTDAQPRMSAAKGHPYFLVLRTTGGEENLGGNWSAYQAQLIASMLNRFFATPNAPILDVVTNAAEPSDCIIFSLFGVGLILLSFAYLQTARIEVMWNERIFRLIRHRFPLPSRTEDFPLDEVLGAYVTQRRVRNGNLYGVSLRVKGKPDVALPAPSSSFVENQRRGVAEIEELLRLRDAGGPPVT